jgi:predicted amidohydrolase YtcJ
METQNGSAPADVIYRNGKFLTLDPARPNASAVAVRDGRFAAAGDEREVMRLSGPGTRVVDLLNRRVIPGLDDSHIHVIRGGMHYGLELRWDGVPSLADGLAMLAAQAARTPEGQWVRVVGGWSEYQFTERRMPTLAELNAAAPDTPVFVMHLYQGALLNRAALEAVGYTSDTAETPGSQVVRDYRGHPTGMLLASPNALLLYSTLAKGPVLDPHTQQLSTRHFLRELNRFGITSVIDAAGGFQNYPDDYAAITDLAKKDLLSVRIAYNLFAQRPGREAEDFTAWTKLVAPGDGDAWLRFNGAGENIVWSAADFENFLEPRPDLAARMEDELARVLEIIVPQGWPFRIHATYDQSIRRFLNVFEKVDAKLGGNVLGPARGGVRWWLDHAETISPDSMDRVAALGGGVAIQARMAYQGEYFTDRYGAAQAAVTPPIRQLLDRGIPLGAGTDATRVASYNPWVALSWLVTGRTVGGHQLYGTENRLDRLEALHAYTEGSAWFSGEQDVKGRIAPGRYADFAVLSADYLTVPDRAIAGIEAALTVVGGKPVYAAGPFEGLAPDLPALVPAWLPPVHFGGYRAHRAATVTDQCFTA